MLTKLVTTFCKIFHPREKFQILSQVLVKISKVEIHTFWGSGQFMETGIFWFQIVHWWDKYQVKTYFYYDLNNDNRNFHNMWCNLQRGLFVHKLWPKHSRLCFLLSGKNNILKIEPHIIFNFSQLWNNLWI